MLHGRENTEEAFTEFGILHTILNEQVDFTQTLYASYLNGSCGFLTVKRLECHFLSPSKNKIKKIEKITQKRL